MRHARACNHFDEIVRLFTDKGAETNNEAVSQATRALQYASPAREAGGEAALVTAALSQVSDTFSKTMAPMRPNAVLTANTRTSARRAGSRT